MSTAPDGLGHHCATPFNDDPAQSKRLLELAAAYRAARAKKLSATGHRAPTYHYLTDNGWLVAHVPVARQLHDLVIKGIAAGDVPTSVATFEPHEAAPAVISAPTGRKRKAG